jgi:hypothetical protein
VIRRMTTEDVVLEAVSVNADGVAEAHLLYDQRRIVWALRKPPDGTGGLQFVGESELEWNSVPFPQCRRAISMVQRVLDGEQVKLPAIL